MQAPKKDNEMVIVAEKADTDFYQLWYYVIRGKTCNDCVEVFIVIRL